MALRPEQLEELASRKRSQPEQVGEDWRIRRHDGKLVGWYTTRTLAIHVIATTGWLL